jgi:hypothetical protein
VQMKMTARAWATAHVATTPNMTFTASSVRVLMNTRV